MTSRIVTLLAALTMVLALAAVPVGAQSTAGEPSYDLDRVREAQARAADEVGPPPAELSEYFAEQPANLAHAQQDEFDLPRIMHATVEDLPAMQEQMRSYLATKYRAQSAAAKAAGEPMVFKVPVLMFGIHGDQWQQDSTADNFERLLSGVGTSDTGSVTELYREMSFGAMEVDFDVYGPYDSVVANAPGNQCFYGTYGSPITGDMVGLGGGGARGMAAEAVPMADPDVDFGQYDNDLDGAVDFLIVLHSGPDAAATGDDCHVWSHYFGPLNDDPKEPTMLTSDRNANGEPVYVSPVMTIPEVDLQIGVTAHELMHALGEPDYYGTAGTAGTGDWDLGAGGSWSGIPAQTNSVHFNPVMKINFGWIDPQRVDGTMREQALRPRASFPDLLQVPVRTAAKGSEEADLCDRAPVGIPGQNNNFYDENGDCLVEGYLIENVSGTAARFDEQTCTIAPADFDRQVYGSGLMVWHWDFTNYESLGNNKVMRPMLDIEEFDRRDALQELSADVTRAEPLDVFWGDPVGISSATQIPPSGGSSEPVVSETVASPPTLGAVPAEPQPQWTAADVAPGTAMVIDLSWDVPTDDWDLYVDKRVDGEWEEVADSAAGAPQTSEQVVLTNFSPGEEYRARAYNWLAPTSPQAEVTVSYDTDSLTMFGPAGTYDNDLQRTGWAFTNIGPDGYRGVAHAANQPREKITLDLVKHDATTVDVSGDFVRVVQEPAGPVVAGEPVTLETVAYNHGGWNVTDATVALYDGDPADGGSLVDTTTVNLAGYERQPVQFETTLDEGLNELYVVASAPATSKRDESPGNDVVRTELRAFDGTGDVLIVDNDRGWTREQAYEATLNALGVSYDIVTGEPDLATLADYEAVIWITTTVSGRQGVLSTAGQEAITDYLDDGGRLWMTSTRLGAYADPDWLGSYFGLEVDQNLLDSMGTIRGVGQEIGGTRSIDVGYLDGRPYWDYGRVADNAEGLARTLFVHSERPEDAFVTQVTGDNGFRTVYGLPLAMVEDGRERWRLTSEVMDFLAPDVERHAPAADELQVRFERFQHVQVGEDRPVTVGVVGPEAIDRVELVHRPYGAADWRSVELSPAADGVYTGVIPGAAIGNNGLEYFARVTTGGEVVDVDGGPALPDIASAPYGDPVDDDYCERSDAGDGSGGDGSGSENARGGGGGRDDGTPSSGVAGDSTARDTTERQFGDDRIETSVVLSTQAFETADTAVLARADDFPDALTAATLAAEVNGPILLTDSSGLDGRVRGELDRLGVGTVYLTGGEQALSRQVADDVTAAGMQHERVAGPDRFATAVAIAKEVVDLGGRLDGAIVALGARPDGGDAFPDALAASQLATRTRQAVLLTSPDTLPNSTRSALGDLLTSDAGVTVAGGPVAISDDVEQRLRATGRAVGRVAGGDRYATATKLADRARQAGAAGETVWVTSGTNFPDALAAGSAAYASDALIVLTDPLQLSANTRTWLQAHAGTISRAVIVGGPVAVSQDVDAEVEDAIR